MQIMLNVSPRKFRYNWNTGKGGADGMGTGERARSVLARIWRNRGRLPLVLLLCTALLILLPVSRTNTPDPGAAAGERAGPVVGYLCKELTQPWFTRLSKALETSCLELGASKVIVRNIQMSPIDYLVALDDMISQGVDCLVVCPPDEKLSRVTVERCAQAGILVLADSDPLIDEAGRLLAPAITVDGYACGLGIGHWLGNYVLDHKLSLERIGFLCLTMESASGYIPRHRGAVDGFLEKIPNFPLSSLYYADYDGTSQAAFDMASAAIVSHPEVKYWIAMAPTDEGAQSICRVLEQGGLEEDAAVVGVGGYAAREEFKRGTECFKASAYIDGGQTGHLIAIAVMNWYVSGIEPWQEFKAEGERYGRRLVVSKLITPETYLEVMRP